MSSVPVIEVRDLRKSYRMGFTLRPFEVLKGLSFTVYENELYGFLGPNGAGKTTTIKILNTIVFPDAGEVRIFGSPLGDARQKARMGFLPEQPYFYEYLTAFEFLKFCGNLFGLSGAELEGRIHELLKLVGLEDKEGLQLRKFSKGMLQRIGIAQALINDPELVILDEPMSGLDPIGRMEIRELIRGLKEKGKTVFFSSHIISDVELLADRVLIIHRGERVAEGKIEDLIGGKGIKFFEMNVKGLKREVLGEVPSGYEVFERGGLLVVRIFSEKDIDGMIDWARDKGGKIVGIIPVRRNLEELFVEKVAEN